MRKMVGDKKPINRLSIGKRRWQKNDWLSVGKVLIASLQRIGLMEH